VITVAAAGPHASTLGAMVHMRRAAPAHTATGVADALNGKYIYVTILQKLYISIATAHRDLLLCTRFLAGASTSMLADAPAAADAERARLRPTRLWLRLRARDRRVRVQAHALQRALRQALESRAAGEWPSGSPCRARHASPSSKV